jgi:hypothetical protein
MENMDIWNKLCQPPKGALKPIQAGRLKGKTDINPMWRFKAMTELFGPCGTGWKYTIDAVNFQDGAGELKAVFVTVSVYYAVESNATASGLKFSDPVEGVGGAMFVAKEKSGPYTDDEAVKKAVTDALGTALKMIGVAADVYSGKWDGSKYIGGPPEGAPQAPKQAVKPAKQEKAPETPPKQEKTQEEIDKGLALREMRDCYRESSSKFEIVAENLGYPKDFDPKQLNLDELQEFINTFISRPK